MPLTAIESFAPLSAPPDDFDRFWEATLAALDEVPSAPVLARESAPAEGLTLDRIEFTSLGQARIAGYLLAHDGPEPKPLVVHSHGYNSQYDVMLHWARAGCHVFGIDFRGFGRSPGTPLAPGGYVLTGPDLAKPANDAPAWPLRRDPWLLETNVPGVFAAGDIRHQSIKRIASATGEGAMAIQFVHRHLTSL